MDLTRKRTQCRQTLVVMLRQLFYILTIGLFISCSNPTTESLEFIAFADDPREKDICFKPTSGQIERAEKKLVDYLNSKTENNQTIFVYRLDEKIPLQDYLHYYKRRYFGRTNIEGIKIIKIEFVFVRCGGREEWKQIEYTTNDTRECWWSVQYDLDNDQIFDLNL